MMNHVLEFFSNAQRDSKLKQKLKIAEYPEDVVSIAVSEGYNFNVKEMKEVLDSQTSENCACGGLLHKITHCGGVKETVLVS